MKYILSVIILFVHTFLPAQQPGSLPQSSDTAYIQTSTYFSTGLHRFIEINNKIRSTIIPVTLITYGFISLENDKLKLFDDAIKEEIGEHHPNFATKIDNYLQYAPAMMAYGLSFSGIKGKNNFRDKTIIYLISNAIMGVTVQSLKSITKVQRPDGIGTNAFPSGHTATAFVAAEFLRQEYKNVSPWYGVGGYLAASTTAVLRLYNNRHWFRDLLPGTGIGILSTKITYWIYPSIKRYLFKNKPINTVIMPYYNLKEGGLYFISTLR